jgi:hypothetical protein
MIAISSGFERLCGPGVALCRLHVRAALRSGPQNSPAASTCDDRAAPALVRFRRALRTAPGAPVWGRAPRWNTETDLTPPAAATLSRDPTRFGHQKIRGSPAGSVGFRLCDSGAVRPCFLQRFTGKGSQWGAIGVRVGIGCNPGSAAKVHSNEPTSDCG